MRITLLHSFYSKATPSGENSVVEMQSQALISAGHEVQLVAAATDELRSNRLYTLKAAINVATGTGIDPTQTIKEFSPQVIHVHNLFPNFATSWLDKWEGPLVATVHNYRALCAAGTLSRNGRECSLCPTKGQHHAVLHKCYRGSTLASVPLAIRNRHGVAGDQLLRRADSQIFLSTRSLATYRSFGLPSQSNQVVVPNFVEEPQNIAPRPVAPYWMFVGRLTQEKGILELLKNWPDGIDLLVFGDGPASSEARSISKGRVRFMGVRPRSEVLDALSTAQGLAIPSLWAEGLPTVYLEALSVGCPVVTLVGNSVADDLSLSPGAGRVVSGLKMIGGAITDISARRAEYAAHAKKRFLDNFGRDSWLKRIEAVYADVSNLTGGAGGPNSDS